MLCKEYEHEDNASALLNAVRYVLHSYGSIAGIEFAPRSPAAFMAQLLMNKFHYLAVDGVMAGLNGSNPLDLDYIGHAPLCYVGTYAKDDATSTADRAYDAACEAKPPLSEPDLREAYARRNLAHIKDQ